jgi:hypothetical protein
VYCLPHLPPVCKDRVRMLSVLLCCAGR